MPFCRLIVFVYSRWIIGAVKSSINITTNGATADVYRVFCRVCVIIFSRELRENKLSSCFAACNIFFYPSASDRNNVFFSVATNGITTSDSTFDPAIIDGDDIFIGMAFFTRPANCIESINGSTRHF